MGTNLNYVDVASSFHKRAITFVSFKVQFQHTCQLSRPLVAPRLWILSTTSDALDVDHAPIHLASRLRWSPPFSGDSITTRSTPNQDDIYRTVVDRVVDVSPVGRVDRRPASPISLPYAFLFVPGGKPHLLAASR